MSVEKIKKLAADLGVTLADLSKAIADVAEEEKKIYRPREDEIALAKINDGIWRIHHHMYDCYDTVAIKREWKPLPKAEYIDMIGRTFAPPGAEWYAVDADGCMFWYKLEPTIIECIEGEIWCASFGAIKIGYKDIIQYIGPCDWKNSKGKVNP